ncbi:MAG TPA: hypothetical protein VGM87_14280 [Roseomonas sp.]|jgi:hypothetical protein
MRTVAIVALLATTAVPLMGCVVNPPREPERVVVREPAPPTTTYVTPPPTTTYVTPPPSYAPRAPSVTVNPY